VRVFKVQRVLIVVLELIIQLVIELQTLSQYQQLS
jgi:hypothetical protein